MNSILMDYPVEANRPPIARFRLNESHFICGVAISGQLASYT
ncbi:hypothetical protein [Nostoc sp.]